MQQSDMNSSEYLPKDYFERPKMGFGFPLDEWLRSDLKEWAEDILFTQSNAIINPFIEASYVKSIWTKHLNGQNRFSQVWTIIMLKSWLKERNF